jgi:TatD DNase family protein
MIDFHCHLDLYPDPWAVRDECERRSIFLLSVTTTPSAWKGTSALAATSKSIQTGLGMHPQIAHHRRNELALFDSLLSETQYVGEVGLDGAPEFRKYWGSQTTVFEHILMKCREAGGRIISLHSRHASGAVLKYVRKYSEAGIFILHWFSGNLRELEKAAELGCWFSIGPAMLASSNGRALVMRMPRDRVLTETDGPFARINGETVMPWDVDKAIRGLSELWSLTPVLVEQSLYSNLRSLTTNPYGAERFPLNALHAKRATEEE